MKINLKIHQTSDHASIFFCFRMRICSIFIFVVHTGLCIQNFFSDFADLTILNAWFFLFSQLIDMPWDTWRHPLFIYISFVPCRYSLYAYNMYSSVCTYYHSLLRWPFPWLPLGFILVYLSPLHVHYPINFHLNMFL